MDIEMMIDYRTNDGMICRKVIDNMEFCVKEGRAYFVSRGERYSVVLRNVIQVYTTDT